MQNPFGICMGPAASCAAHPEETKCPQPAAPGGRRRARAPAVTSPHLAPAAGGWVARGGRRGGVAGQPRPFSRDFAPAGSRLSSPRARGFPPRSGAWRAPPPRERVRAERARPRRGLSQRRAEAVRGAWLSAPCAQARTPLSVSPPRPSSPAGAAAEAGREERPSAPRADGGASPPRLSRCTQKGPRGRALPARAAAWVSTTAPATGLLARGSAPIGLSPWQSLRGHGGARTRDRLPCALREPPPRLRWGRAIANLDKVALAALLLGDLVQIGFLKKNALIPPHLLWTRTHRHFVIESWKQRR